MGVNGCEGCSRLHCSGAAPVINVVDERGDSKGLKVLGGTGVSE